jgi:hypothetical protein
MQDDRSMLAAHAQQNAELVPTSAATHDGHDQADDASDLADLAACEKARRVHKRSRSCMQPDDMHFFMIDLRGSNFVPTLTATS